MADHPLCCDCDLCLNGSGGMVLAGAGQTHGDHLSQRERRPLKARQRRDAVSEEPTAGVTLA